MKYNPFEIRYDNVIREGTAELYNWFEAGSPLKVLYFHSRDEFINWKNGAAFRLINHWTKPAPPPRYR
jgi:hypothetical protein